MTARINRMMIDDEQENNIINQVRDLRQKLARANAVLASRSNRIVFPQEFVAPATPDSAIEPTSTDFTGCFMSGIGRTFDINGTPQVINIGGVTNGVLQFGGSQTDGKFCAGQGAVCLDEDGVTIDAAADPLTPDDQNVLHFKGLFSETKIYHAEPVVGIPAGYITTRATSDNAAITILADASGVGFNASVLIKAQNADTSAESSMTITDDGDAVFSGNLEIDAASAFYLGDKATDGSWRIIRSGNNLVIERRESGSWVTKSTISA